MFKHIHGKLYHNIPLMVQKSGKLTSWWIIYPIIYRNLAQSQVVGNGDFWTINRICYTFRGLVTLWMTQHDLHRDQYDLKGHQHFFVSISQDDLRIILFPWIFTWPTKLTWIKEAPSPIFNFFQISKKLGLPTYLPTWPSPTNQTRNRRSGVKGSPSGFAPLPVTIWLWFTMIGRSWRICTSESNLFQGQFPPSGICLLEKNKVDNL